MLIAFVFIYRAACQVFLPHVVFSFLYENQFSEAPTGTAPSSASACVWQHKFVCAQLILGMTARGMVKWEGHSWLWCNCNKKQNKTLPVVWTPPKKKKKKSTFLRPPQLMFVADGQDCDSGTVFSNVGDDLAREAEAFGERRAHHHPSSRFSCHSHWPSELPAPSTQPANSREREKYHWRSKTTSGILAKMCF